MITGVVTAPLDATIVLQVQGPGGLTARVEAVIDTGCSFELVLSGPLCVGLGLLSTGPTTVALANGQVVSVDTYAATIIWNGRPRSVSVAAMDGGPLVGMELLQGHLVVLHVVPDGPVSIAE